MNLGLNHLNQQHSREETITQYARFVEEITPYYEQIRSLVSRNDYLISDLFSVIKTNQKTVNDIWFAAGNVPLSDEATEPFTESAYSFISDVVWLFNDMTMFAERSDLAHLAVRFMVSHTYIPNCEKSKSAAMRELSVLIPS